MNPTTISRGYAVAAGEGERTWIVADTMTFKATGESTGGSLVLLENLTAPGGGPPPHVHTREDEFFYVLDGTFEIRIGDALHPLGPGGFAYVPRGTVHNLRNTADTPQPHPRRLHARRHRGVLPPVRSPGDRRRAGAGGGRGRDRPHDRGRRGVRPPGRRLRAAVHAADRRRPSRAGLTMTALTTRPSPAGRTSQWRRWSRRRPTR